VNNRKPLAAVPESSSFTTEIKMGGSNHSPAVMVSPPEPPIAPAGMAKQFSKNVAISMGRVAVNSVVALVLPAYLTHHLPVTTYAAWVLILQLGAFVSFLDFGVQTGVAKFVAEYDARGDEIGAARYASAGFGMMILAALIGLVLTLALAWQVPRLFHSMPAVLYQDVRLSVLLVGSSLSFGLACSVFAAVFIGLQRYTVPVAISILNRGLYTLSVCAVVFLHGSLTAMGIAVALINISTGLLQVVVWRAKLRRIKISLRMVEPKILKQMLSYCLVLAIWSAAMLCISGLDLTIVGHYDFKEMPAASALSTLRTPFAMGGILFRATRYATILMLLTGLPLLVVGYPILRLWVGPEYALHSVRYLYILVSATMLRNLCLPYATMVVAIGKQQVATAAAIAEAAVNLGSSIYLAHSFGAIGVAAGTLIGAFVSVSMHFGLSMHYTHSAMLISRMKLFWGALVRSALIAVPSAVLFPFWWNFRGHTPSSRLYLTWALATLLITWFAALNANERRDLLHVIRGRIRLLA
jgi:O-antigen/teichoic acid export membrane protein